MTGCPIPDEVRSAHSIARGFYQMDTAAPLAIVLGGGEGRRLLPLTRFRSKPAMPFAARWRVIDLAIGNLYNSEISRVFVLTQYETKSLHRHLRYGWYDRFGTDSRRFLEYQWPRYRQDRLEKYRGTADAVLQNLDHIQDCKPSSVLILAGDHVYLMDYRQMVAFHQEKGADVTVAAVKMPRSSAAFKFGILQVESDGLIVGFEEKPEEPRPLPGDPDYCLVSMGNYQFETRVLIDELIRDNMKEYAPKVAPGQEQHPDSANAFSSYDFGHDVLPAMLRAGTRRSIYAYDFTSNVTSGMNRRGYWRDVGSIIDYYEANMAQLEDPPPIELDHPAWPIYSYEEPVRASFAGSGGVVIEQSLVAPGVRLRGSRVARSLLSSCVIADDAEITDSVLFGGRTDYDGNLMIGHTEVGRGARIRRCLIDKNVLIPPGAEIGFDEELDTKRGFTVKDGVTIVPRNYRFR
jgi:glucose-1-phosphate adenylyltransferase